LTHSGEGIWLDGSLNNSVVGNSLASNQFGIRLHGFSCFNSICENNIVSNSWAGVRLQDSSNNSVCRNDIADNWEGLEIKSSSDSNSIIGNTLRNNGYGIWFERTLDNKIYHNNFMDDNPQVYLGASAYANVWDDGCPSGGNYWRYYKGVDFRSGPYQNETGSDGIADASYTIDVNNTDRYPLMAPFNDFSVGTWNGVACSVDVISNYTVSGLSVEMTQKAISFRVIGQAEAGFCRVTIPNVIVQELWGGNYTVLLNDEPCSLSDWTDTRNTYIYVNCTGSTHELSIIPEYTSVLILSLFMLTMPIALFLRRKRTYQGKRQESRAGFKSQE
jgi:parallel beta-helix repeat protein